MDMSAAYYQAVRTHLPDAAVVFDWFHIVSLLNDKLSELRRELFREATDQLQRDVPKPAEPEPYRGIAGILPVLRKISVVRD